MEPLKPDPVFQVCAVFDNFTFHYGAIKTRIVRCQLYPGHPFTFHYGAIKTILVIDGGCIKDPLHSTMEPLKLELYADGTLTLDPLHSTMEPLKLEWGNTGHGGGYIFTFHYGAIKTH